MAKVDTTWSSNKRSLWGFLAFITTLVVAYLADVSGLIVFVLAIIAWYVAYNLTGEKKSE